MSETKTKRTRKTPDAKGSEVIEAFSKLPFDIKASVLPSLTDGFNLQKEQMKKEAQAILDKLK